MKITIDFDGGDAVLPGLFVKAFESYYGSVHRTTLQTVTDKDNIPRLRLVIEKEEYQ